MGNTVISTPYRRKPGEAMISALKQYSHCLSAKALVAIWLTTAVFFVFTSCTERQLVSEPPNIVFILVDDLGWADLGCTGSRVYETPNLDRLAAEGMIFSRFYSGGPVCSPGRAALMTGKATARTGITGYLITPEKEPDHMAHRLDPLEFTLGQAFLKHEYATGYVGKWHLGYKQEDWAGNRGFQFAVGGSTSANDWREAYPDKPLPIPENRLETYYFSPYYSTHLEDGPVGECLTDRLTDETIKFIESNREKPFFAFLSFHAVHTPLDAKREVEAKFRKKINEMGLLGKDDMAFGSRVYQNLPEYAAMVYQVDENVGRLMDKLDALGLADNTIVVFTSDNGGKGTVTSNAPLRGAKHGLYEGGIRVPFIVRWPGKVKADSQSDTPLCFTDCYPTLLDLAGLPLEPQQHVDGVSFKAILTGEQDTLGREALYWHYPHGPFQGVVRLGDYKLVYGYKTGQAELYDLGADEGERNDIGAQNPELVTRLKAMLGEWLAETGARFPKDGIIMP